MDVEKGRVIVWLLSISAFYYTELEQTASRERIQSALQDLTHYLFRYQKVKPFILIDEYDTPIQAGFTHGYYDEIMGFLRTFLSAALKTNAYLQRAVLTGILRISKESLFSDLNNIKVHSIFSQKYSEYFGFTEEEIIKLLEKANLKSELKEVSAWYNGYLIGNTTIYNPCMKRWLTDYAVSSLDPAFATIVRF